VRNIKLGKNYYPRVYHSMCWFGRKDTTGKIIWVVIAMLLMTRCNQPKFKAVVYCESKDSCYFVDDVDASYLR